MNHHFKKYSTQLTATHEINFQSLQPIKSNYQNLQLVNQTSHFATHKIKLSKFATHETIL